MIIPIALSFIPLVAVFLCLALLVKDFKKTVGILACLLGLLAFIPIMGIDLVKDKYIDGSQFSQLVKFLGLALVEEGVKMLLLFILPSKKVRQGAFFSYSVLSGMTLGCFETLLYIAVLHAKLRWPAIAVHAICSGLSGIFVYSIKKKNILITPFIFAVLFHGVYNYFADFSDFRHYFAYVVILIAAVECKLRYEVLKADLAAPKTGDNFRENKFSKGDSKNMGVKDWINKLFGKKDEYTETDLPEQTVFSNSSTTVSSSDFDSDKTEEAAAVPETKEEEVIPAAPVAEEKPSGLGFSSYPPIDKLFNEEEVPEPIKAEPKKVIESFIDPVEEPAVKRTRTTTPKTAAASASSSEVKVPAKRGRKPKSATTIASENASATTARTRKTTAKSADATAATEKKPRKRRTAAEIAADEAAKTAKKTTRAAKTTTAKATGAAKTTAKKAAGTAKETEKKTTRKAAGTASGTKKTTTKTAAEKKTTAAKKTGTTAKTTAAKKTTATAAKKTAATKTAGAKKTAAKTTAKKTTTKK